MNSPNNNFEELSTRQAKQTNSNDILIDTLMKKRINYLENLIGYIEKGTLNGEKFFNDVILHLEQLKRKGLDISKYEEKIPNLREKIITTYLRIINLGICNKAELLIIITHHTSILKENGYNVSEYEGKIAIIKENLIK